MGVMGVGPDDRVNDAPPQVFATWPASLEKDVTSLPPCDKPFTKRSRIWPLAQTYGVLLEDTIVHVAALTKFGGVSVSFPDVWWSDCGFFWVSDG